MEDWLASLAHHVGLTIELVALLVIAGGTVEAVIAVFRVMLGGTATGDEKRNVWLRYSRWLVAGLTFQVAADVVHTSVAPSWDDIGRLAAIAAIRTALSYFLERDAAEVRALQHRHAEPAAPLKRDIPV